MPSKAWFYNGTAAHAQRARSFQDDPLRRRWRRYPGWIGPEGSGSERSRDFFNASAWLRKFCMRPRRLNGGQTDGRISFPPAFFGGPGAVFHQKARASNGTRAFAELLKGAFGMERDRRRFILRCIYVGVPFFCFSSEPAMYAISSTGVSASPSWGIACQSVRTSGSGSLSAAAMRASNSSRMRASVKFFCGRARRLPFLLFS